MGFFNKYPYTDFHELNLDWFLAKFKPLYEKCESIEASLDEFYEEFGDRLSDTVKDRIQVLADDGTLLSLIAAAEQFRVNVVAMGVDNTGVEDSSAHLYELFKQGGSFYLPAGTYLLKNQLLIPSNVDIKGDGTNTILKADASMDAVYHTVCSENAADINARLARNVAISGYPDVTLCDHYVENVRISDLLIDGNWQNRNLEVWQQYYSHDGYDIERERGTNLELQRVRNVILRNVHSINGLQHNINIRAAANSYQMGLDYVALYPSYNVKLYDCYTNNERYDDGITTHDSEYITIENCMTEQTGNADGSLLESISNGIEIDDGSRFVTVSNCISKFGCAGFQAKGHDNTPAAHDIVFINCTAQYTRDGFLIACGQTGGFSTDTIIPGRCYNIEILNCKALNLYPFNNVTSWTKSVRPIDIKDAVNVRVRNFTFDPTRPAIGTYSNLYIGDDVRTIFNLRATAYNIMFDGIEITADIVANYVNTALFNFDGNSGHLTLKNVKMRGYTGTVGADHMPIIKYNNTNFYNYLEIDGFYAKRTNEYDKILKVGNTSYFTEVLLQGERTDMLFYNVFHGNQDTAIYGMSEESHTGETELEIDPVGNKLYILSEDCDVTLGSLDAMKLYPIGFSMSTASSNQTIDVHVTCTDQPAFDVTKTLHPREVMTIYNDANNGLMYS